MTKKFAPGDLVQLKSGSPVMTVDSYETVFTSQEVPRVFCLWFSGKKAESAFFREETLEPAKKDAE